MSCFERYSTAVNQTSHSFYSKLGRNIGNKPRTTILISLLITAILAGGILAFWNTESRSEKLWIPQDSQAIDDKKFAETYFEREPRFASSILTPSNGNLLTVANTQAFLGFYEDFRSLYGTPEVRQETFPGLYNHSRLCFRSGAECLTTSYLDIFDYDENIINNLASDSEVLDYVNNASSYYTLNGFSFDPEDVLGGIVRDGSNQITGAAVGRLTTFLQNNILSINNEDVDPPAEALENSWDVNIFEGASTPSAPGLSITGLTETSLQKGFSEALTGDLQLVSIGYMLIIGYACVMIGRTKTWHSRISISLAGVVSVGLSIAASFGLCAYMGLFYGPVHSVLPFLLLGIGVDDMFIIVNAYYVAMEKKKKSGLDLPSIPDRMSETLGEAGLSITITSITDFFAFCVGASTILPALSSFCLYAAFGILLDFIFQVTFFVACFALLIEYEENGSCCCCCPCKGQCCLTEEGKAALLVEGDSKQSRSLTRSTEMVEVRHRDIVLESRADQSPKDDSKDANDEDENDDIVVSINGDRKGCCRSGAGEDFIRHKYGPCLMQKPVKAVVICLFFGWLAACIYGASQLEQRFEFNWFIPDDYHVQDYFDDADEYFATGTSVSAYIGTFDYYTDRAKLDEMKTILDNSQYLEPDPETWYNEYKLSTDYTTTSSDDFYDGLENFLANSGSRFSKDVVWVEDSDPHQGIFASRMNAVYKESMVSDSEKEVDAMEGLRDQVSQWSGDAMTFVYASAFLFWEQFAVIVEELTRNLALSLSAIFIIVFTLVAHPLAAIWIALCVTMSVLNVVGIMYFWDLTIDSVSVVNLVLALGLAVDYSVHIGHNYMMQKGTRNERMISALAEVGGSVINGAFSTFLAVVVLAASKSYIFVVFFKMFFAITTTGIAHGLILLPVLMSIAGPEISFEFSPIEESTPDDGTDKHSQNSSKGEPSDGNDPTSAKISQIV